MTGLSLVSTRLPKHRWSVLKPEWIPNYDCRSFNEARRMTDEYMKGYYSQFRPHQHNGGLLPNKAEQLFYNSPKSVAKITLVTTL